MHLPASATFLFMTAQKPKNNIGPLHLPPPSAKLMPDLFKTQNEVTQGNYNAYAQNLVKGLHNTNALPNPLRYMSGL
jgi:hypothetical protein